MYFVAKETLRARLAFGRQNERIEIPLPVGGLVHRLDLRLEVNPFLRLGQRQPSPSGRKTIAYRFNGGFAAENNASPGRDEREWSEFFLSSLAGLTSVLRLVPSVETLGYSRKSFPGLGHDELLEVEPRLRAGVFIREEEDQAAPPLRELVQEQSALAARPGSEQRRGCWRRQRRKRSPRVAKDAGIRESRQRPGRKCFAPPPSTRGLLASSWRSFR